MSFISKIWNWRPAVTQKNFTGNVTFYRVTQQIREIIIEQSKVSFIRRDNQPLLYFNSVKSQAVNQFLTTIHSNLSLKQFTIQDNNGATNYCFQWSPEPQQLTFDNLRYGCSFLNEQQSNNFSQILLSILEQENLGKSSKIKTIKNAPIYMNEEYQPKSVKKQGQLNDILLQQAQDQNTKMANSCKFYEVNSRSSILLLENAVFSIKSTSPFKYSLFIFNINGQKYLQKQFTSSMSYEIDIENGQLRWVDLNSSTSKIYSVIFDKYQVAINVQFAFAQCLYQAKNKKKLRTSIEQQQIKIQSVPMEQEHFPQTYRSNKKQSQMMEEQPIVNTYVEPLSSSKKSKTMVVPPSQFETNDQNRLIFQAKATDRAVICSGQQVNIVTVDKNQNIKTLSTNGIVGIHGQTLTPTKIVMHDSDSKAIISSADGKLIYSDFVKFKPIQQLNSQQLFNDFCPQSKGAELGHYNNLIGVTQKGIYAFDPKRKNGSAQKIKQYVRINERFSSIAVRQDESFAVGSTKGNIRLYDKKQTEHATAFYAGFGDPVIHMESTKDGKWLLSTFKTYIILLPTHNNQDQDLYYSTSYVKQRPSPRKLTIKNEHLKFSKSGEFNLLKAKFDESLSKTQKFIISGFGQYIVVWSLQNVIAGNLSYTFSKSTGVISDIDFKFNDSKKILTATLQDIHIEHNNLK